MLDDDSVSKINSGRYSRRNLSPAVEAKRSRDERKASGPADVITPRIFCSASEIFDSSNRTKVYTPARVFAAVLMSPRCSIGYTVNSPLVLRLEIRFP